MRIMCKPQIVVRAVVANTNIFIELLIEVTVELRKRYWGKYGLYY